MNRHHGFSFLEKTFFHQIIESKEHFPRVDVFKRYLMFFFKIAHERQ